MLLQGNVYAVIAQLLAI